MPWHGNEQRKQIVSFREKSPSGPSGNDCCPWCRGHRQRLRPPGENAVTRRMRIAKYPDLSARSTTQTALRAVFPPKQGPTGVELKAERRNLPGESKYPVVSRVFERRTLHLTLHRRACGIFKQQPEDPSLPTAKSDWGQSLYHGSQYG